MKSEEVKEGNASVSEFIETTLFFELHGMFIENRINRRKANEQIIEQRF